MLSIPAGVLVSICASSGAPPAVQVSTLNAKGLLFLPRPGLAHHATDLAEYRERGPTYSRHLRPEFSNRPSERRSLWPMPRRPTLLLKGRNRQSLRLSDRRWKPPLGFVPSQPNLATDPYRVEAKLLKVRRESMSNDADSTQSGDIESVALFPSPHLDWSEDDPSHPGYVLSGSDDTPGRKAYFIHLEAKVGKEDLLEGFLRDINAGVDQEALTGPWFALRYSRSTFFIFEAFPDAGAQHTYDKGPDGRNFLKSDLFHDMLVYPAQLYRLNVLHGKFGVMLGQTVKPV